MFRRFHPVCWLLLAVGLAATFFVLVQRYRAEGRSRAVALVLDYGQLRSLASATGVPVQDAYRQLKAAGITGIALTEETLGDLVSEGQANVVTIATPTGREYRLTITDPVTAARVSEHLEHLVRGASIQPPPGDRVVLAAAGRTLYIPGRLDDIRATPTGLDAALVREVQGAGFQAVGRLNNALGATPESIRWTLERVKTQGVTTLIFAGEEVLGFKGLIPDTAKAFRDLGLVYGSIELGKQRGDDVLTRLLADRHVRVHSISSAEMPRLTPQEAIERYVRAASERNIRLLYVRLPGSLSKQTFQDSVSYVDQLSDDLVNAGFGLAEPVPFGRVLPAGILGQLPRALVGLGLGAGAALLLAGLVPIPRGRQALLALVAGLACFALILSGVPLAQQLVALLGAVVFPTLAFVLFPQPIGAFAEHSHATVRQRTEAVVPAVAEFAAISGVTLVGALMVAATLSELEYLVKIRSFAGIKAATVIPILLVGWIYLTGMTGEYPDWRTEREAMLERLRTFFDEPFRVWHTVAALVGLVALVLVVARSGNDPGVGVSGLELRFRALLDSILGVRPRTKEFAIGHPALILSLAMAALPRWRVWALPVMLLGVIGQVGMLNSFCHLHSPLKLTIIRTLNGLWIGGLLGLVLAWAWLYFLGRRGKAAPEPLRT